MTDYEIIDQKVAEKIQRAIILKEKLNINQKTKTDAEMVTTIQKVIQEEVKSYKGN